MTNDVKEKEIALGTLYDFNRQAFEGMKPLKKNVLKSKCLDINSWMANNIGSKYFMFLSNEERDYTIINLIKNNYGKAAQEIMELIESRGEALSIDRYNNSYEVWVKSGNDILFYMLFPCDGFIIEVE